MNQSLKAVLIVVVSVALSSVIALGQSVAFNSGSLGAAGNGINGPDVTLGLPGATAAGGDTAVGYDGLGAHTSVPFNSILNPPAGSPFTVEFWVKPATDTAGPFIPCPLFNRVSSSPRSGWIFFQGTSAAPTIWNFRMYDGVGQAPGIDLIGGSVSANTWSHLVAVWDGSSASLFWNGNQVDSKTGPYQPNPGASLTIGSYDTGIEGFPGSVDEVAIYLTALTPGQIAEHYAAAASATPGAYSSLVLGDGAVEYLQQVPEPSLASFVLLAAVVMLAHKARLRADHPAPYP